ncbi:MAG: TIGR02594 family protein [Methyloceanibacter sp.]
MADLQAHRALPSDPPWLKLAFADHGLKEASGSANNPKVVAYYRDAGHPGIKQDSVPWCAAFVGAMLKRADLKSTGSLLARSYLKYGKATSRPKRGDIMVFPGKASWQGHVNFYLYAKGGRVYGLGGNQSNAVTVASYPQKSVLGYRTVKGGEMSVANKAADNFKQKAPPHMVLLMQDFGFDADDAAAIMGNFGYESAGLTVLEMAGVSGWPHWTGARRAAFEAYCERNKLDPNSDKANYGWVWNELKGPESGAVVKIKAAIGLRAKVEAFEQAYERAKVDNYDERYGWAVRALDAWQEAGSPMPQSAPASAPGPVEGPAGSGAVVGAAIVAAGWTWEWAVVGALATVAVYLLIRYREALFVFLQRMKNRHAARKAEAALEAEAKVSEAPDLKAVVVPLLKALETRFDPTGSTTLLTKAEVETLKVASR